VEFDFRQTVETIGKAIDFAGVAAMVLGGLIAFVPFALNSVRGARDHEAYRELRHGLGRAILIGLEILVAADIIRTVAVRPTYESIVVLAGIVAIRTFLSFTLELEISGRWPWQKTEGGKE
jgi:uncharacterized membrane protein